MKVKISYVLTWRTHLICIIISFVMAFTFLKKTIYGCDNKIISFYNLDTYNVFLAAGISMLLFMLMLVPISLAHELLHGLAYKCFGRKVKFGFKIIYAYTMDITGKPIEARKFLVVLLTPLVVMSIVGLLLNNFVGDIILILNTLGASGDIYMCYLVLKYGIDNKILDSPKGFDVIYKENIGEI